MLNINVKNIDATEHKQIFLDGSKRTVVVLKSVAIGRGEYLPGWQWSKHVKPQSNKNSTNHIGYIIAGKMIVRGVDGEEITVSPGDAFEVNPGHDAWVVGDKLCVALDFQYLKK